MHWNFDKNKPYFVLDPEGDGIEYFRTIDERDKYAAECIQQYFDSDGWHEEVVHVVAGVVTHCAQQTERKDRPGELDEEDCDAEGIYWDPDWDFICKYKLLPIDHE